MNFLLIIIRMVLGVTVTLVLMLLLFMMMMTINKVENMTIILTKGQSNEDNHDGYNYDV